MTLFDSNGDIFFSILVGVLNNQLQKMLNISRDHQQNFEFSRRLEFLIGLESPKVCDTGGTPETGGPHV